MNKRNLNMNSKYVSLCVFLLSGIMSVFGSEGIQSLACNDHLNISVGQDCEVLIEPDMILEGGGPYDPADFIIQIQTTTGAPVLNPIILDVTNGHTQEYEITITEIATNNSCWSTLTLEDKLDPQIECPCPPDAWVTDPSCQKSCTAINRYINGTRGQPDIIENCGEVNAVFDGAVVTEIDCGVLLVSQTWHVVQTAYPHDIHYYNSSCTNEYYFFSPGLGDIDCPDDQEFSCEEFGTEGLIDPENTGYPEINGVDLVGEINPNCNISAGYSDQSVPACQADCSNNEKLVRTWTIVDWCLAETEECIQIIKTTDFAAPSIIGQDMVISTGPWSCSADVIIPEPQLHDNCDYQPNWFIAANSCGALITDVNGQVNSPLPKIRLEGVPKGLCDVIIGAIDCCGNIGYDTIQLQVKDLTPPTIVATQNIIVGLTSGGDNWDGTAKLEVGSIDNGSHDNCSPLVFMEIRREEDPCDIVGNTTYSDKIPENCDPWYDSEDHDYGQFVKFCCADLTEVDDQTGVAYGLVKVWVRVWDDANMDGVFGSYNYVDLPGNEHDHCEILDNYNELWVHVRVEDKSPISLICPPDITIPCDWDNDDLSVTGMASASGACDHYLPEYTDWPNLHCGEGFILREWSVPGSEYICVQRITVEAITEPLVVSCPGFEDFEAISGNPDIVWVDPFKPNHVTVSCDNFEFPEPWVSGSACSLIGISESIDTFWFEADACYKAIKSYDIVDWCTGEETSCEFVVSVIDNEGPVLMCRDTCFGVNDFWDDDNDGIVCELIDDVEVEMTAEDFGDCPSEWIKWVVSVDLWSNGTVDLEYSSFLPHSDPYYIEPSQSSGVAILELDKEDVSAPWAIHRLEWKGFDGCGNVSQCVQFVEVTDKKAPTPYCVNTSTALMENGDDPILEIWAKDFNLGSFDNCDQEEDLGYYLFDFKPIEELIGEVHCFKPVIRNNIPCVPDTIMVNGQVLIKVEEVPNCAGYENGFLDVGCITDAIQKWDPAFQDQNGDTHKTTSIRLRGTHWCGENPINVGVFDQKFNASLCSVLLTVHGGECEGGIIETGDVLGQVSDIDGAWLENALMSLSTNGNIIDETNSTELGYAFPEVPVFASYQLRATKDNDDFNGISTYDILLINRHVLNVEPFNTGDEFIAADINDDQKITAIDIVELRKLIFGIYDSFPQRDSWEIVSAQDLPSVQNPWAYNPGLAIELMDPANNEHDFVGIKIGDLNGSAIANVTSVSTETRADNVVNLEYHYIDGVGYQFSFDKDIDQFHGFQCALVFEDHQIELQDGLLSLEDGFYYKEGDKLMISYNTDHPIRVSAGEILFTIQSDKQSSCRLSQSRIRSEVYTGVDLQISTLALQKESVNKQIQLFQNKPNPFDQETEISFYLPQTMEVKLSFKDMNGRILYAQTSVYEAGHHLVRISKNELNQTGVLFYELSTERFRESKRMIIID